MHSCLRIGPEPSQTLQECVLWNVSLILTLSGAKVNISIKGGIQNHKKLFDYVNLTLESISERVYHY